jgi:hypothetical protein
VDLGIALQVIASLGDVSLDGLSPKEHNQKKGSEWRGWGWG